MISVQVDTDEDKNLNVMSKNQKKKKPLGNYRTISVITEAYLLLMWC